MDLRVGMCLTLVAGFLQDPLRKIGAGLAGLLQRAGDSVRGRHFHRRHAIGRDAPLRRDPRMERAAEGSDHAVCRVGGRAKRRLVRLYRQRLCRRDRPAGVSRAVSGAVAGVQLRVECRPFAGSFSGCMSRSAPRRYPACTCPGSASNGISFRAWASRWSCIRWKRAIRWNCHPDFCARPKWRRGTRLRGPASSLMLGLSEAPQGHRPGQRGAGPVLCRCRDADRSQEVPAGDHHVSAGAVVAAVALQAGDRPDPLPAFCACPGGHRWRWCPD